jgi:thiamine biosynthesis lipoprotein
VAIEASAPTASPLVSAVETAYSAVERVGALMHPRKTGSDLARLNAARAGDAISIDPWTYSLLLLARELHALTGGVFDPCTPDARGRMENLDLEQVGRVVMRAPVSIDLGGIAKGFAVDRAIEALHAGGCTAGLVNAGGDLRVFGNAPRPLLVRLAAGVAVQVELVNGALAVSAPSSQGSPLEHRGYYDGSTGQWVAGRAAAVLANEARVADALTKCVMLCSETVSNKVLGRFEARRVEVQTNP